MAIDRYALKEALKDICTVEDVVEYFGIDRKGHAFRCPGHLTRKGDIDHMIGNCYWNGTGRSWHCNCGAGGDIFELVMEVEGCSFPEAIMEIADLKGVDVEDFTATPESIEAAKERRTIQNLTPFFQLIGLVGKAPLLPKVRPMEVLNEDNFDFDYAEDRSFISLPGCSSTDSRKHAEIVKNEYTEGDLIDLGAEYDQTRKCYRLNGEFLVKYQNDNLSEPLWLKTIPAALPLQRFKKLDPDGYRELILSKIKETQDILDEQEKWGAIYLNDDMLKVFLEEIRKRRLLLVTAAW